MNNFGRYNVSVLFLFKFCVNLKLELNWQGMINNINKFKPEQTNVFIQYDHITKASAI